MREVALVIPLELLSFLREIKGTSRTIRAARVRVRECALVDNTKVFHIQILLNNIQILLLPFSIFKHCALFTKTVLYFPN